MTDADPNRVVIDTTEIEDRLEKESSRFSEYKILKTLLGPATELVKACFILIREIKDKEDPLNSQVVHRINAISEYARDLLQYFPKFFGTTADIDCADIDDIELIEELLTSIYQFLEEYLNSFSEQNFKSNSSDDHKK